MPRLLPCAALLVTFAACGQSKVSAPTTCVPLEAVASECPPDWNAAKAAKDAFCAKAAPFFDAFFSTARCHDKLHYTRYLFDGGPRYCVYDPATLKLVAYGAFDGKAMFERFSCGLDRADFDDQGCAGDGCPVASDAGALDAAVTPDASVQPDASPRPDGSGPMTAVHCDLVDQDCPSGDTCTVSCEFEPDIHLAISCRPIPNPAKLGEPCGGLRDAGEIRFCDRGLGCFASVRESARCYQFCRAGSPCPDGTTCDTTSILRYGCPGDVPAGLCR
jgi:hypothetical protein